MMNESAVRDQHNPQGKWFNSPLFHYKAPLTEISQYIPSFERRGFSIEQPNGVMTRLNERLQTVVRKPVKADKSYVPVGVVSKDYVLVQHTDIVQTAAKALTYVNIDPKTVKAEMAITEYGERMALSIYLPDKYNFDPGDGHPLAMRLECLNSVEGSTRFRSLVGWFRFVCSNGLVIGVTRTDIRRRHVGNLSTDDIGNVLIEGIADSDREKQNFKTWQERTIDKNTIRNWADNKIHKIWGFKAATRVFHIALEGHDVKITGNYKNNTPTTIPVKRRFKVPGSPEESRNAYDVSQILAWIAKERNDLQEQLEWRQQIPALMEDLLN